MASSRRFGHDIVEAVVEHCRAFMGQRRPTEALLAPDDLAVVLHHPVQRVDHLLAVWVLGGDAVVELATEFL